MDRGLAGWYGERMGSVENRQQPRADLELRVDYQKLNTFFADYTKNISKGGTFIKTPTPLALGTRFRFALSVPRLPAPFSLLGEVTRSLDAEAARQSGQDAGMGIRFVFDLDAQRLEFEAQVERLMLESLGPEIYRQLLGKPAPSPGS